MRVLIVNTSECIGGAAIAASRLMQALKKNGVKAKMLVRDKQTDRLTVHSIGSSWTQPFKFLWERLCIFVANNFSRKGLFQVDIANIGFDIVRHPEFERADVVHLHWINQGFVSLNTLEKVMRSDKKVVVTLHDQWYFTGVCHYSGECVKYMDACRACDLLGRGLLGDLSQRVFLRKQQIYGDARITFVGCSRWMADMARKSSLARGQRVVDIPNAIDTDFFCVRDKMQSRSELCLPKDMYLLLFGCQRITDERKGFGLLAEALRLMKQHDEQLAKKIALVVVGGDADRVRSLVPFRMFSVNYVSDPKRMVQLYNAVDLYVTPSLQDNLPNTIMESMACGTPCIGFNVGGIPEMIDHRENGYVADYKDAGDFADGIMWALNADYDKLSQCARKKVLDTYSEEAVARKYMEVYEN